jgi:hypothetical protein
MTKYTILESEKERILKMHRALMEQTADVTADNKDESSDDKKINLFGTANDPAYITFAEIVEKCLKLKKDKIKPSKDKKRYFVSTVTDKGNTLYFYSDMTATKSDGTSIGKYYCPQVTTTTGTGNTGGAGNQTTPSVKFDQAQIDALNALKKEGFYYMQNPPSQFMVDQGQYVKLDISGKDSNNPAEYLGLVTAFSKYFPQDKFKNGLNLYKKTTKETTAAGPQKINVTKESCKTAVFALAELINNPNSTELTNDQIVSHIKTAKMCSDPRNKLGFLNLDYQNAMKKVKERYFKYN